MDAVEDSPFLNMQRALLGLQRLSTEEGELPSQLGRDTVPMAERKQELTEIS